MGIVGVELFFTISGFIITHLLLRERQRDGGVDLRRFWIRRVLRIVPPFAAAALGIAIAAASGVMVWHRSEEHTSELQSLMRISYAVFCLKKKKEHKNNE